ncbi:MAG: hypothetical protein AB7F75_11060 [Planctomycetota bacterium]
MQTINLLPMEMRPKEATPLKLIATLYVGVALIFSLIMWGIYLQAAVIPPMERTIEDLTLEIKALKPEAEYYDRLKAENEALNKRAQMVDDLRARRIEWALKLDQLWDIMDSSRTSWLASFTLGEVESESDGKKKDAKEKLPQLTLQVISSRFQDDAGPLDMTAESLIKDFIDHIKSHEDFVREFDIEPPTTWAIADSKWVAHKRLTIQYQVILRAKPYDEKTMKRKSS